MSVRGGWIVLVLAAACGSRTGLNVGAGTDEATAINGDGGATLSEGGGTVAVNGQQGALCSFYLGPVESCDAGPASAIQRCDSAFPNCVNAGGNWACCAGTPPFNGPGGNCRFGGGPSLQNDFVCP